jgi:hypothetical protein
VVERHFGDARFGEDGVNASSAKPVSREQPQRGVDELIALPLPFCQFVSACEMALSDKQFGSGS